MPKQVLDIGNCGPDHASLSRMLKRNFAAEVHQADQADDAFQVLNKHSIDLILVNRKLDIDYSDGIEVIRKIKADPKLSSIPVMLITNYEEHQQTAMEMGAERGFGKLQFDEPSTQTNLARFLA